MYGRIKPCSTPPTSGVFVWRTSARKISKNSEDSGKDLPGTAQPQADDLMGSFDDMGIERPVNQTGAGSNIHDFVAYPHAEPDIQEHEWETHGF